MNSDHTASGLQSAHIEWKNDQPLSSQYGDLYYSEENGSEESRYVFVKSNQISERLKSNEGAPFTIAETGFGTGLNFLVTLKEWDEAGQPCPLNYVSIEKHPVKAEDIQQALKRWPSLSTELEELVAQYPPLIQGAHQLWFRSGQVTLTLIWGDIHSDFAKHSFEADAWYLDGFNPAKNPEMWTNELFRFMACRSKPRCTFATFTAAGFVRRGLRDAGFEVEKQPGYGRKREMLIGRINASVISRYYPDSLKPWFRGKLYPIDKPFTEAAYDVAVIGAGLAGLNSAYALASKGLKVVVVDKQKEAMSGASGQEKLIMYSKLPAIWNREARLATKFLYYGQNYYSRLQHTYQNERFWDACGQIQLDWNDKEVQRSIKQLSNHQLPEHFVRHLDKGEASRISGLALNHGGTWYQGNGTLTSKAFARALLAENSFETLLGSEVKELKHDDSHSRWELHGPNISIRAKTVVIATAHAAKSLSYTEHLPLKAIRGQSSTTFSNSLKSPACVLCGEGYLCPSENGSQHFGATYDLTHLSEEVLEQDHFRNIEKLASWLPEWADQSELSAAPFQSKAGLRCTTPDYFPIVGPAPDAEHFRDQYSKLSVDASAKIAEEATLHPGLFVNVGHGSKGLVSTALAAGHLAAIITGAPSPLEQEQIEMLSPSRFLIRTIIRGEQ